MAASGERRGRSERSRSLLIGLSFLLVIVINRLILAGDGGHLALAAASAAAVVWLDVRLLARRHVTPTMGIVSVPLLYAMGFLLMIAMSSDLSVVTVVLWATVALTGISMATALGWRLYRNRQLTGSALRFLPAPPEARWP
jgi:hypothetical protein